MRRPPARRWFSSSRRSGSVAPKDKDDGKGFADLVGEVDRRVEKNGRLPPDTGARATRPGTAGPDAADRKAQRGKPPEFIQPDASAPLLAYVAGVDRATFRRLRDGRSEPDAEVDLHGLASRDARLELEESVRAARAANRRLLLVVHGRGQHSQAGPVLKTALPGWLREAPLAYELLAFAPAGTGHGGSGATLLLLRKKQVEERA